jgi:hypothetical protein
MRRSNGGLLRQKAGAILGGLLLLWPTSSLLAQTPESGPAARLSAEQLDDLVAPVALYPDSLLGQVLAASTYPLEIVEAQQWMQQNRGLQGGALLDAAKQQNWDGSVQALVAFPNVLTLLNRDIQWTTDLGNAFLAQQDDLMNSVQRMRARARDNGKLSTSFQQTVTTVAPTPPPAVSPALAPRPVAQPAPQPIIEIQPANPQIVYVPTYNPVYVWGPPAYAYPALGYPAPSYGLGFNPGVLIGALFSGLLSFSGWGWALNWLTHALFLNNLFFGHFGFGGGGDVAGRTAWAHNPVHRLGVAYPNHVVASRFAGAHFNARTYTDRSFSRSYHEPAASARSYQSYNRPAVASSRYTSPAQSYRSSSAALRSTQAFASSYRSASPSRSASARDSAPRVSNASHASHFKAPHVSSHSAGHSSGHSSGGHSKHK